MGTASTLAMFMRLAVSLTVVMGLMWAVATVVRKRGFGPGMGKHAARGVQVEMLARRSLGRNSSIVVIRVGARSILVGVTEQQVTKLDDVDITEIDLDEDANWTASQGPIGPSSAWKTMLDQMRNRTVRR